MLGKEGFKGCSLNLWTKVKEDVLYRLESTAHANINI
jgi:hypothetical protein